MNIDSMIVHIEYYTDPFSIRHQISTGFPNTVYEVWQEDGKTKYRKLERMSGAQVFSYPEFVRDFVATLPPDS
jgi:hypothetical protein